MSEGDERSGKASERCAQLEASASADPARNLAIPTTLTPEDARRMLGELRQAQSELVASRARYFDLYDQAPVGYMTVAGQGRILEANLTACMLLGVAPGTLVSQSISRFMGKDDLAKYHRHRDALFETGLAQACELQLVKTDGTVFWARLDATAARDGNGALVCRIVISDITERKRREAELRGSARRATAQRQAIVQLTLDETILDPTADGAFQRMLEIVAATLSVARTSVWKLTDDQAELHCLALYEAATQRYSRGAVLMARQLPRYFEAILSESRITAANAQTDPRTSELKDSYLVPLGITSMLDAGIILAGRLVGVVCNEHIGVARRWHADEESFAGTVAALVAQGFAAAERRRAEEALKRAHDELEHRVRERTVELTRANLELESARQTAESASRAKSTFLANMSHEIRTPLNAVIGMTELVLKSSLTAQQRGYLMTVKDSGEVLLAVINDILDFSKIEAGKLELDQDAFDLRQRLGDTVKSFALRAHQRGLELTYYIHPDVPRWVTGDYPRLRQIVVNIVGNAIKFTDQGEVGLEVTLESSWKDEVELHFLVRDTGIGVPEDKRTTIFEMFEQADSATTRRHTGSGLGLAIASRLVALMHGQIWVESDVGRGSRFHFLVRLGMSRTPPEPRASRPECLEEMRVLVVDDNGTNRHILEETLRSWNMAADAAPGADEALAMLRQASGAGQPYRLVVSDAHMPGTDGFGLADQIRRDPAIREARLLMLTSGDRPEDVTRCQELGIDGYLLKPVRPSDLLEAIEIALGIAAPPLRTSDETAPPLPHLAGLRVLLAEDSPVNQQLAVALLQHQGHSVSVVTNGRDAVTASESQEFDVILMDVQMPQMDGLEATARIRAGEQSTGKRRPIIAMTAHALKGDRERCLQAGMDAYVAKPIRAEELLDTIDALCSDRATRPPGNADDLPASANDLPAAVDWDHLRKILCSSPDALKAVVQAAMTEIPQLMDTIRTAVASRDAAQLRLAAHTLKGTVQYFGASGVVQLAGQLEAMGKEADLQQAPTCLAALEAEIPPVTNALSQYLRKPSG
jgi:PAS domain S-box-containing protein